MTAGRGIVHSERTPDEELLVGSKPLHGIQIWVALPVEFERVDTHFKHYPQEQLPEIDLAPGLNGRLLIGKWGDTISPVSSYSRTLFVDIISIKRPVSGAVNTWAKFPAKQNLLRCQHKSYLKEGITIFRMSHRFAQLS